MDKPVCLLCNKRLCWMGSLKGLCTCEDPISVPKFELLCERCGSFLSSRQREQLQRSSQRSYTTYEGP